MKIEVKNLGVLKVAHFEVSDLTIICGGNNTGKTYVAHSLYGFLSQWRQFVRFDYVKKHTNQLLADGSIRIDLTDYNKGVNKFLERASQRYSKNLYEFLASSEELLSDVHFNLQVDEIRTSLDNEFRESMYIGQKEVIIFSKEANSNILDVFGLWEEKESLPRFAVEEFLNNILAEILIVPFIPKPFFASNERAGISIFNETFDFVNSGLLERIDFDRNSGSLTFTDKFYSKHPLPVRDSIDFMRELVDIYKNESVIAKQHPEILKKFRDIVGGDYCVIQGVVYFISNNGKVKLSLGESSSSVKALLDIAFYLKHIAKPGDILMVDKPELGIHPENQRKMACFLACLVNIGIKVFITTHSDYIIKEFNTLIMLNNRTNHTKKVMEEYGYNESDLLSIEKIRVYNAGKGLVMLPDRKRKTRVYTFVPSEINSEVGIEVKCLDDTINGMNKIQNELLYGDW